MKDKSDTVGIMGKNFSKCSQEDCEWNIGWLGGSDWTEEPGKGIRICNLGARAMVKANATLPDNCPQPSTVVKMAHDELESAKSLGDGATVSKTDKRRRQRILYMLLGASLVILCIGLSFLIVQSC